MKKNIFGVTNSNRADNVLLTFGKDAFQIKILLKMAIACHHLWDNSHPMATDCMTWLVTFGNGAEIGIKTTITKKAPIKIQKAQILVSILQNQT